MRENVRAALIYTHTHISAHCFVKSLLSPNQVAIASSYIAINVQTEKKPKTHTQHRTYTY